MTNTEAVWSALDQEAGFALPANVTPGLAAATDYQPPALTYTNGAHVVETIERASPSCAKHHADRRDFVFRLHHRKSGLARFFIDAEALQVIDQRFHQRRAGRDRGQVPADEDRGG